MIAHIVLVGWFCTAAYYDANHVEVDFPLEKVGAAIDATKVMIRKNLNENYLPDLYFNLAELYVEKSRIEFGKVKNTENTNSNMLDEVHAKDAASVKLNKHYAIETYDKIIKDFPDYKNIDQCYFFKAHEFREMGEFEQAVSIYDAMIEKYPKSKWTLTARLILGEHYFEMSDFDAALQYYQSIHSDSDPGILSMASNKMGWIYLYQQRNRESLDSFEKAIAWVDKSMEKYNDQADFDSTTLRSVREDSVVALAWAYPEVKPAAEFGTYFAKLADNRQNFLMALRKLGERYRVDNRPIDAARAFVHLVVNSFDGEKNSEVIEDIVDMRKKQSASGKKVFSNVDSEVLAGIKGLNLLRTQSQVLRQRPDAPAVDEKKLTKNVEIFSRYTLTQAQSQAQESSNSDKVHTILRPYDEYLKYFVNASHFLGMKKNAALAHFNSNDFFPAAVAYEQVAVNEDLNAVGVEGDLFQAIVSYARALEQDRNNRGQNLKSTLNRLELLESREALKTLGRIYLQAYPHSDHAPQVSFQIALMSYQEGDFAQAAILFQDLIKRYPRSSEVEGAANLAYDGLYKLEDLDFLAAFADKVIQNPFIPNQKIIEEAKKIAASARQRKIDTLILNGTPEEATKKMLQAFEASKDTKEGEVYLLTVIKRLKEQQDIEGVLKTSAKYLAVYPQSQQKTAILQTMADYAMRLGDLDLAVTSYLNLAERAQKIQSKDALPYLQRAASLADLMGNSVLAERTLLALTRVNDVQERQNAISRIIELDVGTHAWQKLLHHLELLQISDLKKCALAGIAHIRLNDGHALRDLKCALEKTPKNDSEQQLQNKINFEYAHLLHQQYMVVSFSDAQKTEDALSQKLSKLQLAEKAYIKVLKAKNSALSIAAIYNLGLLYQQFAEFVISAPVPSQTPVLTYKNALREQAKPYLEKNNEFWEVCRNKVRQLQLLTPYAKACNKSSVFNEAVDLSYVERNLKTRDTAYQNHLNELRHLNSSPQKIENLLKSLVDAAMQAHDWRYAYALLLGSGKSLLPGYENRLGIILWNLEDVAGAAVQFRKGIKLSDDYARVNLLALQNSFGYQIGKIVKLQKIDTDSLELHEVTRTLLKHAEANTP